MRFVLLAIITTAALLAGPQPSLCQTSYCGNITCINSSICFDGCACAVDIGEGSGVCVSVR